MHEVRFSYAASKGSFELIVPELRVAANEIVALAGPSGAGKTTLLKLIAGALKPSAGSMEIPYKRRAGTIGYVPQADWLFPWLTLRENARWPFVMNPRLHYDEQYIDELLEAAGLLDHASRRPSAVSGGQRRRVSLVRALSYRPHLLLMDEPFTGLDVFSRDVLVDYLLMIRQRSTFATLIVTHELSDVAILADRAYVISATGALVPGPDLHCRKGSAARHDPTAQRVASALQSAIQPREI